MLRFPGSRLSPEKIDALERAADEAVDAGDVERAWDSVKPLLRAQKRDTGLATRLVERVERHAFDPGRGLDVLKAVFAAHPDDLALVAAVGKAAEGARDIDQLNLAAPDDRFFAELVETLERLTVGVDNPDREIELTNGLAVAARMMARQRDGVAERAYRRLTELSPQQSSTYYNYGLWLKTRGRFRDGMEANQRAAALATQAHEAYDWNLGICATGAGEGAVALAVWRRIGQKVEMGRFELPDGGYPECKVRLAERPLAERSADNDDPGLEETIWIERLSPCHGIVRSVLYQDLGVDYGDAVLIDGAPITYHKYGDSEVPVFPHLATLRRGGYRFFDFAGTQGTDGQLESASRDLPPGALLYSHTERFQTLCANCWRDPDVDHAEHEAEEHHVVTGRIAIAPELDIAEMLAAIDTAVADREPCRLFAPDLSRAAGQEERARFEQRRFDMLRAG